MLPINLTVPLFYVARRPRPAPHVGPTMSKPVAPDGAARSSWEGEGPTFSMCMSDPLGADHRPTSLRSGSCVPIRPTIGALVQRRCNRTIRPAPSYDQITCSAPPQSGFSPDIAQSDYSLDIVASGLLIIDSEKRLSTAFARISHDETVTIRPTRGNSTVFRAQKLRSLLQWTSMQPTRARESERRNGR